MIWIHQTCCKYFVHLYINIWGSFGWYGWLYWGDLIPLSTIWPFFIRYRLPCWFISFNLEQRALFCSHSIGVISGVMYKFLRYSAPFMDLTFVLFRKMIALSRSVDTVTRKSLALVPFLPSLVAFDTEVGIPVLSCFLTSLLELVDSGTLCKIRFGLLLSFSFSSQRMDEKVFDRLECCDVIRCQLIQT